MLVFDHDPNWQFGPMREVAPNEVQLVGARHHQQLAEPSRRTVVRQGTEQQVQTSQIVAVVLTADLSGSGR